jgi:SAM-dependent methyltransferase
VPISVQTNGFTLAPLSPPLVKIDFEAYMSSVEHLQKTFTRSTDWPHAGISDADAMKDMETEQSRFAKRTSFAYSVLTPDGKRERGCIYVSPSPVPGYDAQVLIWVTKAEYDAGFDAVTMSFGLRNVVDIDIALRELLRVLAPGGELRIVTDHDELWAWDVEHVERATEIFERRDFARPASAGEGELVGTNFERKFRREGRPFHAMTLFKR